MSKIKVQFLTGTSQQYDELSPSINQYTFYFTTDDQRVYLGTKELTTDVQSGTTEYWNSHTDLTSIRNRIYVYTDYYIDNDGNYVPGLKIGDGNAYVVDLPFIDERFLEHIQNTQIHVTQEQKNFWNNKVSINDQPEFLVDEQNLVFKTD